MRPLENETDEHRLVAAAQADPARFAELYQLNFHRVYAYIARRVRQRQEAEDLTSEVFHEALRNIGGFEWRGTPFAAWLFRIAAFAIADRWRRMGKAPEVPAEEAGEPGLDAGAERGAMLGQLVDALPADQRTVLLRRFVEQRSIREIATELRRSEGAVKQLQFRALQTLRSQMSAPEAAPLEPARTKP